MMGVQQQSNHVVSNGYQTTGVPQYWCGPQHLPQHYYCGPYQYPPTTDMHYRVQAPQVAPVLPPYTAATRTPPPTPFFLCSPTAPPASVTPPPPSVSSRETVVAPEPEPIVSSRFSPCSKSARGAAGNKVNRTQSETDQGVPRRKIVTSRSQSESKNVTFCEVVSSSCPASPPQEGENDATNEDMAATPKKTLRRQQLRLLLLRHAGKCAHENCAVSGCAAMKKLSQHVATCRSGDKCTFKHCATSRYVLGHFIVCRKAGGSKHRNCPLCGPVRQAIERSKTPAATEKFGLEVIAEELSSSTE